MTDQISIDPITINATRIDPNNPLFNINYGTDSTGFFDTIGSGLQSVWGSLTQGISTVIDGVTQQWGAAFAGTPVVVGYDSANRPILAARDPITGQIYSAPSSSPGAAFPENARQQTPSQSWLSPNALPPPGAAPSPGTVPGYVSPGFLGTPVIGGFTVGQVSAAALVVVAGFFLLKAVK